MNSAEHQRSSFIQSCQRRRHQLTGRSKDDGSVQFFRWIVHGAADPFRAEFRGQAAMLFLSGTDENIRSPITRHLQADVSGGPETVNSQIGAPLYAGNTQASKANDSGAKQRRCLQIVKSVRDGVNEILFSEGVLGIASVDRVAREC